MNDMINILLAVFLLYEAFVLITKKNVIKGEKAAKYTPESLASFSMLTAVASIICAIAFLFVALCNMGVLKLSVDFTSGSPAFYALYGIVIAILVVIEILGHAVVLKKASGAQTGKKSKKEEEEDF